MANLRKKLLRRIGKGLAVAVGGALVGGAIVKGIEKAKARAKKYKELRKVARVETKAIVTKGGSNKVNTLLAEAKKKLQAQAQALNKSKEPLNKKPNYILYGLIGLVLAGLGFLAFRKRA